MASGNITKKEFSAKEWGKRMEEVELSGENLNKMVMSFLVTEGYEEAAKCFEEESGTPMETDGVEMKQRSEAVKAVHQGKIEQAVELLNDANPEILDTNPKLYFTLQQQRLIELIRRNDIEKALEFARNELAPRGEENPECLVELEKVMALLAFEDRVTSPVGSLLSVERRMKAASELNRAVLAAACEEQDSQLHVMVKLLVWAQDQLEQRATFPKLADILKNGNEGEK